MANDERDEQEIPRERAVVPVYPQHERVNWGTLFEIGAAAGIAVAGVLVERQRESALHHVREEFKREGSPLEERIHDLDPKYYDLVINLAAAAYLQQTLPDALQESAPADAKWWEAGLTGAGNMARRVLRTGEAAARTLAGITMAVETRIQAEEHHIDIKPFLPLAGDLGTQAFDNRAQHIPQPK